jgi:hypothetical protein
MKSTTTIGTASAQPSTPSAGITGRVIALVKSALGDEGANPAVAALAIRALKQFQEVPVLQTAISVIREGPDFASDFYRKMYQETLQQIERFDALGLRKAGLGAALQGTRELMAMGVDKVMVVFGQGGVTPNAPAELLAGLQLMLNGRQMARAAVPGVTR